MARIRAKQQALASAGSVVRYVPLDAIQIFAFVASPRVRSNPWGLYRRLHRRGPVRPGPYGIWIVASHAAVTRILREVPTTVDESYAELPGGPTTPSDFGRLIERSLLFTDPPDHTRLRRLVSRSFTQRTVEALRDPVQELVDRSIAELKPRGSADLVTEVALPFPVAVIAELLGLPARDRGRFIAWARAMAPRLDISIFRDEVIDEAGNRAARELVAYFGELLDHPDRCDPDGLLVALLSAEGDDDRLQRDELVALCVLLLLAGFETTTNLVANSLHTLIGVPQQLAAVRDGDVDLGPAVDEMLRHDGPVQFAQRVLLEDLELDGRVLPARTLTALLIGAANRDPLVFDGPDDLDLSRSPNPHLSFSTGIHHCLGAALARLEAAVAIPTILRQLPNLELAARPRMRSTFVLRGFSSLPVRWTS